MITIPVNHEPWVADALCADLHPIVADRLFFPKGNFTKAAREMCAACPVQAQCAVLGTSNEYGMFGGISPRERPPVELVA